MTQIETLKFSYNNEIQKLKSEIAELEKKNQNKTGKFKLNFIIIILRGINRACKSFTKKRKY